MVNKKKGRFYAVICIDYEYDEERNPYIGDEPGEVAAGLVVERANYHNHTIEDGFKINRVAFIEEDK